MNNQYKIFLRGLFYGSIAAIVFGTIALYINRNYPFLIMLKAGISQGLFCMAMTFFSTVMMEFFFNLPKRGWQKYTLSVSASGVISLSLLITTHLIAHTPELFLTVLSSAAISLPYYLLVPLKLYHEWYRSEDRLIFS